MLNKIPKKSIIFLIVLVLLGAAVFYFDRRANRLSDSPIPTIFKTSKEVVPIKARAKHVLIVLEENKSYDEVMGNTKDMPYLNMLAGRYAYAKNYYADTHPSIGNYFMLTAGDIITNNDHFSNRITKDNIVRHLISAGKTWKEYSDELPSVGYTGGNQGNYAQRHNPLSYFSDVQGSSQQTANLVPISQLAADAAQNNLPDYSFIVPSNKNDAHDCPTGGNCLAVADAWLKTNIGPIIASPDFNAPGGGILIVTFDESKDSDKMGGGGHVAWVVVGPDIKKGYVSTENYQHENTLRFMSEIIGLTEFPGKAATAGNMGEFVSGG